MFCASVLERVLERQEIKVRQLAIAIEVGLREPADELDGPHDLTGMEVVVDPARGVG